MTDQHENAQAQKQLLISKRDELRSRIEAIKNDFRRGLDSDSGERAVELENAEVLDGIKRAAEEELAQVEAQLARLP